MAKLFYKQFPESEELFGPLADSVVKQLEVRRNLSKKRSGRDLNDITLLNSQAIWVKMTSGVDIDGQGSIPAQENILVGGTLSDGKLTGGILNQENSGYVLDENLGYRPKAGITNFSVKHLNLYGTLRSATVEFVAHSKDQFDVLEQLFLRPGFSVLLEWGHSVYKNNTDDELQKEIETYNGFFSGKSITELNEDIQALKLKSDHNYDGLAGIIKNFSWSFNDNGGYNCTLEIITYGEILESLRTGTHSDKLSAKEDIEKEELENLVRDANCTLNSLLDYDNRGSFISTPYVLIVNTFTTEKAGEYGEYRYIPMYIFLDYINQVIREDYRLGELKFNNTTKTAFLTFSEHTSNDPFKVLFPKDKLTRNTFDINRPPYRGEVNDIMNIWLNIGWLKSTVDNIINQDDPSQSSIYNLVKRVITTINTCSGGVTSLDLAYETTENSWFILDRKVVPDKGTLPKLNLYGLGSVTETLNFNTKLSNTISSAIAISAANNGNTSGEDLLNLQAWNRGLKDRNSISSDKEPLSENKVKEEVKNAKDNFSDLIERFNNKFIRSNREGPSELFTPDPEDFASHKLEPVQRKVMQSYLKQYFSTEKQTPGLIPFELSLTFKGISGIKIGQSFVVDDELLFPKRYYNNVAFIVTGIANKPTNNRWVTDITAQMIIISSDTTPIKLIEDTPEEKQTESTLVRIPIDELKLSPNGLKLIKEQETIGGKPELFAYPDAGNYAIGFGANFINGRRVRQGETITVKQAEELLRVDVLKFENAVKSTLNIPLTQNEFDALISLTYNIGGGAFNTSTIARKLNRGEYISASKEFERWNKSQGKVISALTRRRLKEKTLFLTNNPGD